jgi:hypothetical protein
MIARHPFDQLIVSAANERKIANLCLVLFFFVKAKELFLGRKALKFYQAIT